MIDRETRRHVPRRALVDSPFIFISTIVGKIEVPFGFDTDYASIPRPLWTIYPPDGEYTEAAVGHDFLYWEHATSTDRSRLVEREEADLVFLEMLTCLGIPLARRRIMYRAVQMGGAGAWAKNERMRLGLEPFAPAKPVRLTHKQRK